jgi:hypothetical protein
MTTKVKKKVTETPKEYQVFQSASLLVPDFYTKYGLAAEQKQKLEKCAVEIERLAYETIQSMVAIGSELLKARAILGDKITFRNNTGSKPKRGTYTAWAQARICTPLNISYDTASRWMRIAEEVQNHPEQAQSIYEMLPTALYEIVRPDFPEDLKQAVYKANSTAEALNAEQIKDVKKLYQQVTAQERNITPEAIVTMAQSSKIFSATTVKELSKLDQSEQVEYAKGLAQDFSAGHQAIKDRLKQQKQIAANKTDITGAAKLKLSVRTSTLDQVLPETINLIIIECPLGAAWKDSDLGLKYLTNRVEDILKPGGKAMIFLGHTTILSAASYLTNLKPLTLLTVRRQPGNSTTNIGVNLGYASVHAMLCYKPPFSAPRTILFDLQTFEEDEQFDPALAEVPTGIEVGVCKFLDSLVDPGDAVAHLVLGNRNYGIRPTLQEELEKLQAASLLLL